MPFPVSFYLLERLLVLRYLYQYRNCRLIVLVDSYYDLYLFNQVVLVDVCHRWFFFIFCHYKKRKRVTGHMYIWELT